jgi:GNAT superfamily N-acetyltransferase
MISAGDTLGAADFARMVELQRTTLPSSILGRMGAATLTQFYRWAAESPRECLFADRAGGQVVGGALLSFEPDTVIRRFVSYARTRFGLTLAWVVVRDHTFRRDVLAYMWERPWTPAGDTLGPELLQIFFVPHLQGQGRGTALLQRIETAVSGRGARTYFVRTLANDNDKVIAFYCRRGFEPAGEAWFCAQPYVVLRKALTGVADPA